LLLGNDIYSQNLVMNYFWIMAIVLYFALTHVIALYVGKPRRIGYGRTVFWSILLSPLGGWIIALTSPRIESGKTE